MWICVWVISPTKLEVISDFYKRKEFFECVHGNEHLPAIGKRNETKFLVEHLGASV